MPKPIGLPASAMGSPIVRALIAGDRYSMPDNGPVEPHIETAIKILREVRSQVMDAGLKIGIENHKDLQAWQTRQVIETAGKEFVRRHGAEALGQVAKLHFRTTASVLGQVQ